MVSDDWLNRHDEWKRVLHPNFFPSWPSSPTIPNPGPSREEFDALRREMEELKKLLHAAKNYDEATGQPDCEMEDKVKIITKLAEMVGVDLKDIFSNHK